MDGRLTGGRCLGRGKRNKMNGLVQPAKSKPTVRQKKKKVQPKNDSGIARNVSDKSFMGKRKNAVNNNVMDGAQQEALESLNKISPLKKRKLEAINVVTPSANEDKKTPVEVREEEEEITRLGKSNIKKAYVSLRSTKMEEEIMNKKTIEMDEVKDSPNTGHSEKILELERIIDKLKSEKVTLQDENKSKNEALNSANKEKEKYKEKCVNEAQKFTEMKDQFEKAKSAMDTMVESVTEEVEARKDQIDKLLSEREALQAEIKNKDTFLNLVYKDKEEISLKLKDASQKLVCEAQVSQGLKDAVEGLKMDQVKDGTNIEHSEKILELEQIIDKLEFKNQGLKEEADGLQNAVDSMKDSHKIENDLLMAQVNSLTLSSNQMRGKVANLTKQLYLKGLQTQKLEKHFVEGVNKRAESLAKLYEEKRLEVEVLIKLNEEKIKEKSCEVEMLLNQSQEKQNQLENATRQNEEKSKTIEKLSKQLEDRSQEIELRDSERKLLETSSNNMEKEKDSALQKFVNSQEERRIVDENTVKKVKEFQKKFDEEKEKSVNKAKHALEKNENLQAELIAAKNTVKAEKSRNEQLEEENQLLKEQIKGLEEMVKKVAQNNKLKSQECRLKKQNQLFIQEIADLTVKIERYEELKSENESLKSLIEYEKVENKNQETHLKTDCAKLEEENNSLKIRLEAAEHEKEDLVKRIALHPTHGKVNEFVVASPTKQATFSQQSSLQQVEPPFSVEQQIENFEQPVLDDHQGKECVVLSSYEGADGSVRVNDAIPEVGDDEEVSDEEMQKIFTEGIIENMEEAKNSGKEMLSLKSQYMQLHEAFMKSIPAKIDLCKTSLNEAFRKFYGVTDVSEFLDEVETIGSNVPDTSELQKEQIGFEKQTHSQFGGFHGSPSSQSGANYPGEPVTDQQIFQMLN